MTQREIDVLYNLTILIHENEWFQGDQKESVGLFKSNKKVPRRDREETQEWVSKRLAGALDIYTIPVGMSWGYLTTKERFDEYWDKNSKIKDE
jgi:hypothetical protein